MTAERDGGAAQASSPSGSGPASVPTPGPVYRQVVKPAIDPAVDPAVERVAAVGNAPDEQASRPPFHDRTIPSPSIGAGIGFRTRLTFALIAAAVIPLAVFGLLLIAALR
ncbi:MAG: hypothetical protein ACRDGQ_00055, partial [Candidatus Limnocylindrales bacterium]